MEIIKLKPPYILGISSFYHDSSVTLLHGDEILAAAQEERFTRNKFESKFPAQALEFCLKKGQITLADVDVVAFYEDPLIKWDRIYTTYKFFNNSPFKALAKLKKWMRNKLNVEEILYHKYLKGYKGKILFTQHHLAHAASAFYPSPFKEATIVVLDGIGEWACTSIGHGKDENIKILAEQRFPHSVGFLYSAFTQYLGFKVDSGEYKVMGLAPYGKPIYSKLVKEKLIKISDDGELTLNLEYFDFMAGKQMINRNFESLFNQPKRDKNAKLEKFHFDMAATIQDIAEEIIGKIVAHAVKKTGVRNVVLAGGVALNCVSNGKLIREGVVDDIWIQPCSGDAGTALGAAMLASYKYFNLPRKINPMDSQKGSYLGPSFSTEEIKSILDAYDFHYEIHNTRDGLLEEVVDKIIDGDVVGFFQGRMEYGPRALGARSIIADPRNRKMQENLNLKIKFRESFRPFAPLVLEEKVPEWFEKIKVSPYMLMTTDILPERRIELTETEKKKEGIDLLAVIRSEVPAITHVNYSVRLQTITESRNGVVYELLKKFENKTGCPILINTSFNIRGEPIVCTPYDALQCFMNTNMNVLVLENIILKKENQKGQLVKEEFMEFLNRD